MSFDVIIVGAGPGGLACAEITAASGLKTLVLERKQTIGKKVCAGGVTWNGLVKKVSSDIFERQFNIQHVFTRSQKAALSAATPIIATVNREKLGQQMGRQAERAGAEIRLGCQVRSVSDNVITFYDKVRQKEGKEKFSHLVGADGSASLVRKHLGIPVQYIGVGVNYQLPGSFSKMEWHLDCDLFTSGYAWVFPHRDSVSVGAYVDARVMKAKSLHNSLNEWSKKAGYALAGHKSQAELINFDFRGYHFNNIFLVGDAAGLASGLTGEGIYPAIISGQAVAERIVNPDSRSTALQQLIKNNGRHRKMVTLLGKNRKLAAFLAEMVVLCFKLKIVKFSAAEMAD